MTMYIYAETGTTPNCTDENSFTITINTTPVADDPADVNACDSYTLPALTVGNYFSGTGGTGTAYSAGNNITSSMTMYVYAETGTTPNCTDENSFTITINSSQQQQSVAMQVSVQETQLILRLTSQELHHGHTQLMVVHLHQHPTIRKQLVYLL
ncbi:MAG: hypothetical protein IPI23_21385 [Bacteroidetes bacterium]|nr:hypothetical protein [Bacteroidota bacterium]